MPGDDAVERARHNHAHWVRSGAHPESVVCHDRGVLCAALDAATERAERAERENARRINDAVQRQSGDDALIARLDAQSQRIERLSAVARTAKEHIAHWREWAAEEHMTTAVFHACQDPWEVRMEQALDDLEAGDLPAVREHGEGTSDAE